MGSEDRSAGRRRALRNGLQLLAVAADGTVMELYRYEAGWHLSPTTKAGRGICSATLCEDRAAFLTKRSGRDWALCWSHAQVYAAGQNYWTPGLAIPEGVVV